MINVVKKNVSFHSTTVLSDTSKTITVLRTIQDDENFVPLTLEAYHKDFYYICNVAGIRKFSDFTWPAVGELTSKK